jgi:hypothetical protein
MTNKLAASMVLFGSLMMSHPAAAVPITGISADDIGTTWSILFGGNVGGVDVSDLSAEADVTLRQFENNTAVFEISLTNTTSGLLTSRVSAFGFLTTPNIVSGTSSGLFGNFRIGSFPNQTVIEACVTGGPTCQGGGGGGLTTGNTGSFTVSLEFAHMVSSFDLDGLAVRYQSIDGWSDGARFSGDSGTGTARPQPVPEPATLILFGAGLLGTLVVRRRSA